MSEQDEKDVEMCVILNLNVDLVRVGPGAGGFFKLFGVGLVIFVALHGIYLYLFFVGHEFGEVVSIEICFGISGIDEKSYSKATGLTSFLLSPALEIEMSMILSDFVAQWLPRSALCLTYLTI